MTPPAIDEFIVAAGRGDPITLNALIDWPVSGAGGLVRNLHELDPGERMQAAKAGLANLLSEGSAEGGSFPLGSAVMRLAENPQERPATGPERRAALTALMVPALPPEIDPATAAALRDLAGRASSITDVHVVEYDRRRSLALGVFPDGTGLAIIRHFAV